MNNNNKNQAKVLNLHRCFRLSTIEPGSTSGIRVCITLSFLLLFHPLGLAQEGIYTTESYTIESYTSEHHAARAPVSEKAVHDGTRTKQFVSLVTFPIPLMVESEQEGLFIDLARAIEAETNLTFAISVLPTPRAVDAFEQGTFDVIFPALDTLFQDPEQIHRSKELLYIKHDFVFTHRSSPLISDIRELEGLRLGLTRGYPYAREITGNEHIKTRYLNTDELNAQMLVHRRIDAFLVEESSGVQAFKNTDLLEFVHYPPRSPVSSQDVYFAFQRSQSGRRLEHKFSLALSKLKENGFFETLMSKAIQTGLEQEKPETVELNHFPVSK